MNDAWWVGPEQLKAEQQNIVVLPLDKSHLIVGPPGSGKTNLLLLRANYMYLAGQANLSVIVFTRTLREYIAAGSSEYNFPIAKVITSAQWHYDVLR